MRLGVISDTHGHLRHTLDAVRMFESLEVQIVIHCGDIGSEEIVELFGQWPTHFVFGNVDHDRRALETAIRRAGQTCHGCLGRIVLANKHVAFTHGDQAGLLRGAIDDGQADLVCHGHTHVARCHDEGKTRVLNPGAIYRANPRSVAVVELESLGVTIVPVGGEETRAALTPPGGRCG
jgi:putative phosphoesterase